MANSRMILEKVRADFVHLDSPYRFQPNEDAEYSLRVIVPKDSDMGKKIRKAWDDIMMEEWGKKVPIIDKNRFLKDGDKEGKEFGDDEDDEGIVREHLAGCYFFRLKCPENDPPGLRVVRNEKPTPEDVRTYFYSGAYFHVSFRIFTYNYAGKNGIGVRLENVMFAGHGDRLGGSKPSADDEFAEFNEASDLEAGDDLTSGSDF